MTQRELLYIKTIAEEKSISKAAAKLFLSQPSLSQCISRIEKALGTKLFIRTNTGLNTTYIGERYVQVAAQILKIYSDFESEIGGINNLQSGRLTIGMTSHLASHLLPKILPTYKSLYPNVEIYIAEESSAKLETMILHGEIDFAIMHTHNQIISENSKGLEYFLLYEDSFVLTAPIGTPLERFAKKQDGSLFPVIDLKCCADEDFIMVSHGKRIRQVSNIILNEAGIHPKIVLTTENFETARRLACSGVGVTLLPHEYTKIFPGSYNATYFSLPPELKASWSLSIVVLKDSYVSAASREFIRMVTEHYLGNKNTI